VGESVGITPITREEYQKVSVLRENKIWICVTLKIFSLFSRICSRNGAFISQHDSSCTIYTEHIRGKFQVFSYKRIDSTNVVFNTSVRACGNTASLRCVHWWRAILIACSNQSIENEQFLFIQDFLSLSVLHKTDKTSP
jgi:hypothetical protein